MAQSFGSGINQACHGAYGVFRRGGKAVLALALGAALPIAAMAQETGSPTLTIAALGDSLTQGYGLPPEQGLVPQLQDWLRAQGHDVFLINAGVSGDTTAGGLSRIDWTLGDDVDGLIVALGANDILRGIAPEVARANLDAILGRARDADVDVLLVGLQAPGNYGADYQTQFNAIYPDLSQRYGTLYAPDFFEGFGVAMPSELQSYLQPDGLHPNAQGVAAIIDGLGPYVAALIERLADE